MTFKNLGPKSRAMLAAAGIDSMDALRELGSVRAYLAVKRSGGNASLNLLWALEGALQDCHWQEVAKNQRLSLLLQLDDLERALHTGV